MRKNIYHGKTKPLTLYYEYAMKCGNKFVADWFELNLNINNVLTAITCRKYGFDKANYIVGHNEIARKYPYVERP